MDTKIKRVLELIEDQITFERVTSHKLANGVDPNGDSAVFCECHNHAMRVLRELKQTIIAKFGDGQ